MYRPRILELILLCKGYTICSIVISQAFYPEILTITGELRTCHHPRRMSGARGWVIGRLLTTCAVEVRVYIVCHSTRFLRRCLSREGSTVSPDYSMALTRPKAPFPRLVHPDLYLIDLCLLSLGLFIPRFCMSPCSPDHLITPEGFRALVGRSP